MGFIEKIFGTHSENELKRIYPIVDHIEALEPEMQQFSDGELKNKTREFRERLEKGETLDDLLPEAFAVVRRLLCGPSVCATSGYSLSAGLFCTRAESPR